MHIPTYVHTHMHICMCMSIYKHTHCVGMMSLRSGQQLIDEYIAPMGAALWSCSMDEPGAVLRELKGLGLRVYARYCRQTCFKICTWPLSLSNLICYQYSIV